MMNADHETVFKTLEINYYQSKGICNAIGRDEKDKEQQQVLLDNAHFKVKPWHTPTV